MLPSIGRMRHRLTLEAPREAADGAGGVSRSYADVATVWAAIAPASARARMDAAGQGQRVTHVITIRARSDISTRHRLRRGTRVYHLRSLHEDAAGLRLVLAAEETTP